MKISKLKPSIVQYQWGGDKLHSEFGKEQLERAGESWEVSFDEEYPCFVDSGEDKGKTLTSVITKEDIGKNSAEMPFFPLLIKFIDANRSLAIQVHPSDEYALANENQYGKTEMWYVLSAEPDAIVYYGLKDKITKQQLMDSMVDGTICDYLNTVPAKVGDVFFVASGTIHAIGKGITVYEVQQNSTITYRMFNYNRVDNFGHTMELNLERAADVSTLEKMVHVSGSQNEKIIVDDGVNYYKNTMLGSCKYFHTEKFDIKGDIKIKKDQNTFMALSVVEGCGNIDDLQVAKGDTIFVPAGEGDFIISGDIAIVMSKVL
ncbi:MAG: type I phosphomannose isomerase catalytic subunit [Bacillota bacterium]